MRNNYPLSLLVAAIVLTIGCRQTSGPLGGGPLAPTGALSPVNGQGPALTPFGGSTRVTPPPTGSYSAPNTYMGGVAPASQPAFGVNPAAGFAPVNGLASQDNAVVGSGVQQASGFTETNDAFSTPQNPDIGVNSDVRDPRAGGMRTLDLTNAPPPPGYQPSFPQQPSFTPSAPQFQSQLPPAFETPAFQSLQPTFQQGVRTIDVPSQGQITDLQPLANDVPRTAVAPSTNPISQPGNSGTLQWGRPGTQF
jgi:hypothetical protein